MSAVHRSEADLYLKIAEQEDEIAFLRRQLGLEVDKRDVDRLRLALKLTPVEADFIWVLYSSGRTLSRHDLAGLVPVRQGLERECLKFAEVYVHKLRRRLGNAVVATSWGRGYRLTDAGRALVVTALGEAA